MAAIGGGSVTWQCNNCKMQIGAPTIEEAERTIDLHYCAPGRIKKPIPLKDHKLRFYADWDSELVVDCERENCDFRDSASGTMDAAEVVNFVANVMSAHNNIYKQERYR